LIEQQLDVSCYVH